MKCFKNDKAKTFKSFEALNWIKIKSLFSVELGDLRQ
jgi:hypothetical protein